MDFTIRPLCPDDLASADQLRAELGWNQTIDDWKRLLAFSPQGCFVAEREGRTVGTCTSLSYGNALAWVGMMMVHPADRRQGIGEALLRHCVERLRRSNMRCIKLDATPMGQPLYTRIGFVPEWSMTRWRHEGSPSAFEPPSEYVQPLGEKHWPAVIALDSRVFGVPRGPLLQSLARNSLKTLVYERDGCVLGFGMLRRGSRASYLGPVAVQPGAGEELVRSLLSGHGDRSVFWDVPDVNESASRLAPTLGFSFSRPLTRMCLGANPVPSDPIRQWAIADPATG